VLILFTGVSLALLLPAASASDRIKTLRRDAELFERQANWDKACESYEELLRLSRNAPEFRERYRQCLRHLFQARRHTDPTYRKEILGLKYSEALELYRVVFENLGYYSPDKTQVHPERLFRKGLDEFRRALTEPVFVREHLADQSPEAIKEFLDALTMQYLLKERGGKPITSHQDAEDLVRRVSMLALNRLRLKATTTILEFTCGACHAVDEYTMYLTPGQLSELTREVKGEVVGIGVKLARVDDKLFIVDVLDDSPASDKVGPMETPALLKSDQLLAIDKKSVAGLSPDLAQELLEGESGSLVELVVAAPGMPPRTVTLRRRPVFVPSVTYQMRSAAVGYIQISCFQESTVHELDLALAALTKAGVKSIVLDLRGNYGGLVESAIDATQRFLGTGLIVTKQRQNGKLEPVSANNPAALGLPLVVLIDGETASSAEIMAGALKDNKRARLVGQTTFGKGSMQGIFPLPPHGQLKVPTEAGGPLTGALRMTVARYFSPSGAAFTDRGVTPHLFVERRQMMMAQSIPADDIDAQLEQALLEAQRLLDGGR
jgi:carboxyl-terminal processing protease